jgi:hypothetical protein
VTTDQPIDEPPLPLPHPDREPPNIVPPESDPVPKTPPNEEPPFPPDNNPAHAPVKEPERIH